MTRFTSAITSGPMPSPGSRRRLWVAMDILAIFELAPSARAPRPDWQGTRELKPAEPIVALVLPIAAMVGIGDFHGDHVFRILVAELGRHADFHREAVGARQDLVVVFERHLGLRMQRGRHIDGIGVALGALEPDVFGAGIGADTLEEFR